jgi:acyl-CoA dehydrogenase
MQTIFEKLDQQIILNPEESQLIQSVQSICKNVIAPNAARFDETGEFPWENIHAINELGLNAMFVPEEYGGAPLSYTAYLYCVREISKACASTGIIWATNFHGMKPIIDFGTEDQKQKFLPSIAAGAIGSLAITEPHAGSDATGMRLSFTPDGDDIIIHGNKIFISNGDVADLYLLFGKWSEISGSKEAISALIFEKGTPGFSVVGLEKKMGHHAASTASISFDQCRVPRSNLLCNPGDGLKILLSSLNKSRPSVAAHALGIARAAFEDGVDYINERQQSGKKIIEFQGIQFQLADLASELYLCESLLWSLGKSVDHGAQDFGTEASILKYRATDAAMRIANEVVGLFGGYGYCQDYRAERLMRDAKITQIWEGTNQIHRQLVGRHFYQK